MKNLADIAPLIDDEIIQKFKSKYADITGHYATHTANITNGLSPVMINGADSGEKNVKKAPAENNFVNEIVSHTQTPEAVYGADSVLPQINSADANQSQNVGVVVVDIDGAEGAMM